MSSNVPQWRRGGGGGGQADGGASPGPSAGDRASGSPGPSSSRDRPYNNNYGNNNAGGNRGRGRGGQRGGGGRGFFRGGRGGGGGGGGGYQGQGQGQGSTQGPPIDDADLYHERDVLNHFRPGEKVSASGKGSTFHDSTAHPGQLSYVLLYPNANPRWNNDQIVFAKSNLGLLPEYTAKMLEHGPWDLPADKIGSGPLDEPQEADVPAGDGESSTKDGEPSTKDEAANNTVEVAKDKEIETAKELEEPLPSTQAAQESSPTGDDKEKTQDSSAPSGEAEGANASTPLPAYKPSTRMKYTDVRLIPAEELYAEDEKEEEPEEPSWPSIPPIDYIPSTHPTIAVFEGRPAGSGRRGDRSSAPFVFVGWYKVTRVNLLAPHSAELVRMQQQKWERRDRYGRVLPSRSRDIAAWKSAMGINWAVVKFAKLGSDEEPAPPAPVIERVPEPEPQPQLQKSPDSDERKDEKTEAEPSEGVDEKLSELKLGDTTAADDGEGSTTTPPVGNEEAGKAAPEAPEEQDGKAP